MHDLSYTPYMRAFIAFILIVALLAGLYYGFIFVVGKGFKSSPKPDISSETSSWKQRSQDNTDLMQRQRDLMRQRQDRLRDMQHR